MCNCSHATSFLAQAADEFTESTTQFTSVLTSAQDLTIEDVAKSIGVLLVLVGIWTLTVLVYLADFRKRRIAVLEHLIRNYYMDSYQSLLGKSTVDRPLGFYDNLIAHPPCLCLLTRKSSRRIW